MSDNNNGEELSLYRLVIWILGIVSVLSIIGIIFLSIIGKTVPEGIIALGSTTAGALAPSKSSGNTGNTGDLGNLGNNRKYRWKKRRISFQYGGFTQRGLFHI